jgi:Bacterial Ig domain
MRRLKAELALGLLAAVCSASMGLASPAGAAATAYPDLRAIVPPEDISIGQLSPTEKMLEFTHISWDAGAGPLEIRPSYNPLTGIAQGYQALYASPSPGVWTFEKTVPIVGPMVWDPPSDYRFPLDTFGLYTVASNGGLGSLVATSPKVDFCMTSDTFVGGVPNAPLTNEYPGSECANPNGRLGLTVGWGDQYESTDGGEDINITSIPDGIYWFRAIADPYHYFQESSSSDKITDTKLQIQGNTVKVLEQTHPNSTPPTVTLTSPTEGTAVKGTVTVSATASGPAPVQTVQFLLDGEPLGSPVTSPPYTTSWTVGSTPPGTYYLSAQATDSNGFVGTAPALTVTVPSALGTGKVSITDKVGVTGRTEAATPPLSTTSPGELLLAFADSDGPESGGQTLSVSGAGLTWTLLKRANAQAGDAEIWAATAANLLSGATVTAKAAKSGYDQSLTVIALSGASGVGNSASASAGSGAPTVSLTSSKAGSMSLATGNDWDRAVARTLGPGQALLSEYLDTTTGDTYWTQYLDAPSSAAGQTMTLNDTSPTNDRWNLAAVEVLPGEAPPPEPEPELPVAPAVSITNPVAGQTVSGQIPVSANVSDNVAVSSVQYYLDGKPLGSPVTKTPFATTWGTVTSTNGHHTLSAVATNSAGQSTTSASVEVVVQNPPEEGPCFVVDANATVNGRGTVTAPAFTTSEGGEQLLALVSSDGPKRSKGQSVTISGGGLTWHLDARANPQFGDAEIWSATATAALSGGVVTSTPAAKGYDQTLSVIAVQMSDGIGATVAGGAASGAPSVTLMTLEEGSLVFAVGHDWDNAIARTLGVNQVLLHQYLDASAGDTTWSQYTGQATGAAGSMVTMNDTAPTGDQWDMAAVELRGDGPGV